MLLAAGGGAVAGGLIGTGVGIVQGMSAATATAAAATGAGAATKVLNATGGDPSDEISAVQQSIQNGLTAVQNGVGQGYNSFNAFKAAQGPAGPGMAWHHIVQQTQANVQQFGQQAINNTNNLIKLPAGAGSIHQQITNLTNSINPAITGSQTQRVFQWAQTQTFETQWKFGMDLINRLGGAQSIIDKFP